MQMRKYSKKIPSDINNSQPVQDFRKNHFFIFHNIYDDSLINKIKTKYDTLIENEKYSYPTAEHEGKVYSRHIHQGHEHIPELKNLITTDMSNLIRGYYHGEFVIKTILLWRIYHIPKNLETSKEQFSNYWHCDERSAELLKLFIPLDDISEDNGPFYIMSKERTKFLMRNGFKSRINYGLSNDVVEDPSHISKITCKNGAAHIINPQLCLHRAGNPSQGHHRDAICFVIAPSPFPISQNWIEKFQPDKEFRYGKIFRINKKRLMVLYRTRGRYSK